MHTNNPKTPRTQRPGVLPGYATAPVPTITEDPDGWTATLEGVRFAHQGHCAYCRRTVEAFSGGGTIRLGFRPNGKAFETARRGEEPAWPSACPHCGASHNGTFCFSTGQFTKPGLPIDRDLYGQSVRSQVWETLRTRLDVHATVDMTPEDLQQLRQHRSSA